MWYIFRDKSNDSMGGSNLMNYIGTTLQQQLRFTEGLLYGLNTVHRYFFFLYFFLYCAPLYFSIFFPPFVLHSTFKWKNKIWSLLLQAVISIPTYATPRDIYIYIYIHLTWPDLTIPAAAAAVVARSFSLDEHSLLLFTEPSCNTTEKGR